MEDTNNSTLLANQEKIEALLEEEQQPEDGDMAEYLVSDNPELYDKLYLAEFRVEELGGQLYGRIDCWFTQRPDEDEIDYLREEIIGQAADGFGEHFEQRPICIDEGELYVSFWDCSDDYFMYTGSHSGQVDCGCAVSNASICNFNVTVVDFNCTVGIVGYIHDCSCIIRIGYICNSYPSIIRPLFDCEACGSAAWRY